MKSRWVPPCLGWLRGAVLASTVLLAGCVAGLPGWSSPSPPPPETMPVETLPPTTAETVGPDATRPPLDVMDTILRVEGTVSLTTPRFKVDDSWSINWTNDGRTLFSVQVIPAKTDAFGDLVVSTVKPGKGQAAMYVPGTYVLRIIGSHHWKVTVRDLATRPSVVLPARLTGSGFGSSPMFVADGPWLLEWSQARDARFIVERLDLAENVTYGLVHQTEAPRGCVVSPAVGEQVLRVVAEGGWELRISGWDGGEVVCPL